MIVLKIIGSIILIISAVLYFIYINKKQKKDFEFFNDHQVISNDFDVMRDYLVCFMLLGIAAALLATL